jgi:hypothetical protein
MQKSSLQKSNLQKQVDGLQLLLKELTKRVDLVEDILIQQAEEDISDCSDESSEEFTLNLKRQKTFLEENFEKKK